MVIVWNILENTKVLMLFTIISLMMLQLAIVQYIYMKMGKLMCYMEMLHMR